MNNNVGHNERLYRIRRAAYKAECERYEVPCFHCGRHFDWLARPRTKWSFTVDHRVPRSKGGSKDDPANWLPAHYSCNSRRGNRDLSDVGVRAERPEPQPERYSEPWP